MAKTSGKNAVLNFGATAYACIKQSSAQGTANMITDECSTDGTGAASTIRLPGAVSWTGSATIIVEGSAATVPAAFAPGTSGALKYYPEGDETGQIEYSFTTVYIDTHAIASSTSSAVILDISWSADGTTTPGVKSA
jgi:hypothetical protein